ncbi:MAG TPA: hypothetical protein VHK22_02250 [Gaiellaceae bacterium]|jgi:hypothetical protein|nr:hypothetical protein [Gaiellaceae bacterium]
MLLLAGAGAWLAAQVLEKVQWTEGASTPASFYKPAMVTEEILELGGSYLFGLALLVVIAAEREARGSTA